DLHLDRRARRGGTVVGLDGEGVERAVGVGGGRPDQCLAGADRRGACDDRDASLGERAGRNGLDAERERIAVDVGLVTGGRERGVGDNVGRVLGAAGQGVDTGERGRVVGGGEVDADRHRGGRDGAAGGVDRLEREGGGDAVGVNGRRPVHGVGGGEDGAGGHGRAAVGQRAAG